MVINRIDNNIQKGQIIQGRVNEATSGKKEKVHQTSDEPKKVNAETKVMFSDDAKKMQETEVILQNALQKLNEMDEINQLNLSEVKGKIEDDFYNNDQIVESVVDDIFTEKELRAVIEKRMIAEKYVAELNELDAESEIDEKKLALIRDRIASGYYDTKEVYEKIAEELVDVLDV